MTLLWIVKNKIIHRRRYYNICLLPEFEQEVKKVIGAMRGNIFVDIGSNKGYYSKLAKRHFKKVLSIDPNPKHHAPIQIAVSNFTGYSDLHIYNNSGAADSLVENPHILGKDYENNHRKIRVRTVTFDDLGVDADLVKIDVEGAEFEVLEGMRERLPQNMIVEMHDEQREQELVETMTRKGYNVSKIDGTHFLGERR